jgi:hypothetical protein
MSLSEHHEDLGLLNTSSPVDDDVLARDTALRQLEVARGRERHLVKQVEKLERRLLEAETDVAEMRLEVRHALALEEEIRRTRSWKITAPLRTGSRLLGRR